MKNIIAFVGAAAAVSVAQKSNQEKLYDSMFVQTEKIVEKLPNWEGWHATFDKFPGTVNQHGNFVDGYTRVIPDPFVGDAAETDYYPVDTFTQNILKKYAIEGLTDKKTHPKPTGSFYLTKDSARQASVEVICTHF